MRQFFNKDYFKEKSFRETSVTVTFKLATLKNFPDVIKNRLLIKKKNSLLVKCFFIICLFLISHSVHWRMLAFDKQNKNQLFKFVIREISHRKILSDKVNMIP